MGARAPPPFGRRRVHRAATEAAVSLISNRLLGLLRMYTPIVPKRLHTTVVGARASKRVVAPVQVDEAKRVTRQKTKDFLSTTSSEMQQVTCPTTAHDALISGDSTTEQQNQQEDLFKDFHCSRKTGYSQQVKKAIADMEAIIVEPVQDGEREKTATEVVAQVLPSSSTFLQNAGLQSASKKSSATGVSLQVHELQVELETKRKEAAELKQQIDVQQNELDTLKKKVQDSETAIEGLKKAAQETNALFRRLLSFNRGEINPTS